MAHPHSSSLPLPFSHNNISNQEKKKQQEEEWVTTMRTVCLPLPLRPLPARLPRARAKRYVWCAGGVVLWKWVGGKRQGSSSSSAAVRPTLCRSLNQMFVPLRRGGGGLCVCVCDVVSPSCKDERSSYMPIGLVVGVGVRKEGGGGGRMTSPIIISRWFFHPALARMSARLYVSPSFHSPTPVCKKGHEAVSKPLHLSFPPLTLSCSVLLY